MYDTDPYKHLTGLYTYFVNPFLKYIREEVIAIVKRYHFSNILDLGCGLGTQCMMLDKSGFEVKGVDYSEAMIKRARKRSPKIEYYVEDSSNTHFPDQSFDCVILCFALHENESERRESIIEEVKRLLKKDGKLIAVDFAYPRRPNSLGAKAGALLRLSIERFAGRRHYKNSKDFIKGGALTIIESKFGFSIVERHRGIIPGMGKIIGMAEMVVAEHPS